MEKRYVYIFAKKFGLNGKQKLEKFIFDTGELYQEFAKNKNRYALSSEQLIKAIKKDWISDFDILNEKEYIGKFVARGESVINSRMTLEERKEIIQKEFDKLEKEEDFYISDPFIFANYHNESESLEYLKIIFETVKPRKVFIFHSNRTEQFNNIKSKIAEYCNFNNNLDEKIICTQNNKIHDRFYITKNKGICVGTSISGFHNKLFIVNSIEFQDVTELKRFLKEII